MHIYRVYGLTIATDFAFIAPLPRGERPAQLTFECRKRSPDPALLEEAEHLYTSPGRVETVRLYHGPGDAYVLRFMDVADYYLWPDSIVCHLRDARYWYGVEIWLLGHVLSFWMEWQETPALHASGVVVDGNVAAFLATNRGGKTSLAATLMQQGCPLLTDDILALELGGRPVCLAAYPQMRMWPDLARHFTGSATDHDTVHPYIGKLRVPVDTVAKGSFQPDPAPLGAIYIPERMDELESSEITPAAPHERFQQLLRHTFAWMLVEAAGLDVRRFQMLGRIARDVPIRHLRYPDGLDHLPHVAEAVQEDMNRLATRHTPVDEGANQE